jgi:hypothetical protein
MAPAFFFIYFLATVAKNATRFNLKGCNTKIRPSELLIPSVATRPLFLRALTG